MNGMEIKREVIGWVLLNLDGSIAIYKSGRNNLLVFPEEPKVFALSPILTNIFTNILDEDIKST